MRCGLCFKSGCLMAAVLLALAFHMNGCGDDDTAPTVSQPQPQILASVVLPSAGCHNVSEYPVGDVVRYGDCISYALDHAGTLTFRHLNASFNCCLDSVAVTITRTGSVIKIEERQLMNSGGCDCDCLTDVEYAVDSVEPGVYTFEMVDPYRCQTPGYSVIRFTVDLAAVPSGQFCINRCCCPWDL